jgi:DNA-binding HxlR family transcriptional regulator
MPVSSKQPTTDGDLKPRRTKARGDDERIPASSLIRAINVVGDVWTALILKEAFLGAYRFQELHERLHIPRQTLMLRLASLTDHQILFRRPVRRKTLVHEYRLTPKGLDLYDFILSVWVWHRRWDVESKFLPRRLVHRPCGHDLEPRYVCRACNNEVRRESVATIEGDGSGLDPRPPARLSRQNDIAFVRPFARDAVRYTATTIIGDRWSNLVLHSIFQGTCNFFAIKDELKISSNVLSSRLKKLVALEILESDPRGRRIEYRVTPRGEDFYPMLVSLSAWGDRWLAGPKGPPHIRLHECEQVLDPRYVCGHCNRNIRAWDVIVPGATF